MTEIASQLLMNGIVAGAAYGLIAMSFAIIYHTAHFFHFAHGAVYAAAAYAAFLLLSTGLGTEVAIPAAIVAAAALGALMEYVVYNPLRRRRASAVALLLASLGLLVLLQNIISLSFGDSVRSLPGPAIQEGVSVLSTRVTLIQLATVAAGVSLWIAVVGGLRYSTLGKALRAVADDEELARVKGVDTTFMIFLAFVVGSALVGVAGILAAYDTGLRPTMGFGPLLAGIVGMIVGGVGNTAAAFPGGIFVGVMQQFAAWILPSRWQDAVLFVILIVFLVWRPQGLLGRAPTVTA